MGRPPKYQEPAILARLISGIQQGMSYEHAALYAGITAPTLAAWIKRGSTAKAGELHDFFWALKGAEMEALFSWLTAIGNAEPGWQAYAWKAERRYPEAYGRNRIEVTGKDGAPIEHRHTGSLTLAAVEKIAERIPTKLSDWREARGLHTRAERDELTG